MNKDPNGLKPDGASDGSIKEIDLPEGVPPLHTFYLYLTNGCNLSCRHCWITPAFVNGKPTPGDCLDIDLLKIAVSEGKKLGLADAKLTGGEPILHPCFVEIVDYLSTENIKMIMETNATLIDAGLAKHLKNNTTMWFVSTSLDSAKPEKHDRFRGMDGAFQSTIKGIGHLVDAGYKPQIIMCLHRGNINEVEDVIKLAISLGVGSVKFNPVTPTGRGKIMDKKGETLDFDETINLIHFIRGELQDRYSISLFISTPPAMSSIGEILREKRAGGICRVQNILGILGNGEMALCGIGRNIPELCFGCLGKDSLRDIWESHPTLVGLRQELNSDYPGICGDCIHDKRCLTQCVAMNYVRTGKLINPDFLCAESEHRGVFPMTRKRSYRDEFAIHDK
jgi:SynChlorMet cassette radical SAM/SPASM protein ScmF